MPPPHQPLLEEIHRLTLENNRLLHKMRRGAMWGRLFTLVFYLVLFLGPIWFYATYLNGTVQQLLQTYHQVQGTGAAAQTQMQSWQNAFKQFEAKFIGSSATSTHQ